MKTIEKQAKTNKKTKRVKHRPLSAEQRMELLAEQKLSEFSMLQLFEAYLMVHVAYDVTKDRSVSQFDEIEPGWRELAVSEFTGERVKSWVDAAKERFGNDSDVLQFIVTLCMFADTCYSHDFN